MRTPGYSASQKIGTLGKRVFLGGHPDTWFAESEPAQNSDFGFDMSMWVERLGSVRGRFAVQLKAGADTQPAGPAGEEFIQVQLTPETCNLYLQDGQPVLLVYVALENAESSSNAEIYYLWIEEELRERLGDRPYFDETDPSNMTFRVPIRNNLTKELDVTEHLDQYWTYTRIAGSLRDAETLGVLTTVSSLSPRAKTALASTAPKNLDRWLSNETLTGDSLWPTPKSGSAVGKIKQLNDALNRSDAIEADRLIDDLEKETLIDPEVLAELRYQEGRRAFLDSNPAKALDKFSDAVGLQPENEKFFAGQLEAAVISSLNNSSSVAPEFVAKAEQFEGSDDVTFQLVRILAMQERFAEAEDKIALLSQRSRGKAQAIYETIRGAWPAVLKTVDQALLEGVDNRAASFLKTLRLRALLNIATDDRGTITVGGPPTLAVEDARALRGETMEFFREAQAAGWPANSEMGLDCAAAIAVFFRPDRELLDLLTDYARKRPALRVVQESLARVATFIDEPAIAISALEAIKHPEVEDTARLVLLLSESGKHFEAVRLATSHLVGQPHDELVDIAVATAAVSAFRLGSNHEEVTLSNFLSDGCPAAGALYRFIRDSLKHPEEREGNVERLWNEATRDGDDQLLQDNLLQYLRPDREEDIDRILHICSVTSRRRNLTDMESGKFSASLLRRERYDELLKFTERALDFYPDNENVGLSRAIALEKIGQPSAAEQVLRRFDNSVRTDLVSARTQLLLRIGDIESIVTLTKRALAASTNHKDKVNYQRALATLYSRQDRSQYLAAAWRLGELVDKSVEEEEGAFLLHFIMATSGGGVEADEPRIKEFQERLAAFTKRFPDSKVIRLGQINDDAAPGEFLSQLQALAGITPERALAHQKARNFGERSGSHLPIAFRPGSYAPYSSNLADLLRVTINAWHEGESSRLIVGDASFPGSAPGSAPILDLATVFLLVELNLFDKLFSVWTAIAIPKESLAALTDMMFGPLDAGNATNITKVEEAIRRNHSSILQPGSSSVEASSFPRNEFATIKAEVASDRYHYLTMDLAAAAILREDTKLSDRFLTLWDLIRALESRGAISATEAVLVRLYVASWNTVGTPLEPSDIAAASLGAASRPVESGAAASRAVKKYLLGKSLKASLIDSTRVVIELARSGSDQSREAADWFIRHVFIEAILVRSINFNGTTDELAAHLAVLAVADVQEDASAERLMEFVWSALEGARTAYGGSQDKDQFYGLVGRRAADLFDSMVKKHGLPMVSAEARITDLLFSLAKSGTQDREKLQDAYFDQTRKLQG